MPKKTAALLAALALTATLPLAACGNGEGFRRDDSKLDLDSSTKIPDELAEVKDTPARKATEPLPAQENIKDISTDLAEKPSAGKGDGDAPDELSGTDVVTGKGALAETGDEVEVQYVGTLFDTGKEFDSSWKRKKEPFKFTLGQGQVIKGWDEGVVGMKVGGRRILVIPSDLGYGATGSPPSIPADATLVFVVDLEKVTKKKG